MPRTGRIAPGGIAYHVLNRGVGRTRLFRARKDHQAFQRCLVEAHEKAPMRVLGYCVMPVVNALRSKLAERAELWPWSSIGQSALPAELQVPLSEMPTKRRDDWVDWVNQPQTAAEEDAIRRGIKEGRPFGTDRWIARTMGNPGWKEPGRPGRPFKKT